MKRNVIMAVIVGASLVGTTLIARAAEHEGKHSHESVAMKDVPQAAKDALTKEAKGAALENVRKETRNGSTYYEADIKEGGKRVEITARADGTDVKRESGEEEEEER